MANRPHLAAFVVPILFDNRRVDEETALLLLLAPGTLPWLLKAFDTADHLSRRFGTDTELSYKHSVHLHEIPPHVLPTASHKPLDGDAIPVNAPLGFLREELPYSARLHIRQDHLYWSVPPCGLRSSFRTGNVSRVDLMEWQLLTTRRSGMEGAFRRLSEREPYRALSVLERGTCFARSLASSEAYPVDLPREALEGLLSHEEARVREQAIALLGSTKER
jgi:hypothetical protein